MSEEKKTELESVKDELAKLQQELKSAQSEAMFYKEAVNSLPNPIFIKNEKAEFAYFNKEYESFFNMERSERIGKTALDLVYLSPSERVSYHNEDLKLLATLSGSHYEAPFADSYGLLRDCLYWSHAFQTDDGERGVVGEILNISREKELEKNLKIGKTIISSIETLYEYADTRIAITKVLETLGLYYGADKVYFLEIDREDVIIKSIYRWGNTKQDPLLDEDEQPPLTLPIANVKKLLSRVRKDHDVLITPDDDDLDEEFKVHFANSNITNLMVSAHFDNFGNPIALCCAESVNTALNHVSLLHAASFFVLNEHTKQHATKKLEVMSFTDGLTGVYNRNRYAERIKEIEALHTYVGIIYVNINGLRVTNKTMGEQEGDKRIKKVAWLLKTLFGVDVFRLAGDEFVVLCHNTEEEFKSLVEKLYDVIDNDSSYNFAFTHTYKVGKFKVQDELDSLNEFMSLEKQRYYKDAHVDTKSYKYNSMQVLLEEIANGQFEVYMQSKVDLASGLINGAEALIRKRDKEGNMVFPDKFIPLYEKEKIIRHVDFFVVETVCQTLQKWIKEGNPLKISLNLSRLTFMENNLIPDIKAICAKYEIPLHLIDLELTETVNAVENKLLQEKLVEAKAAGFSVSLDDFGTEYSNLLILTALQFSQVKYDKSLVGEICEDERRKIVIEYAIKMCDALDMPGSLAEGIETAEQRDLLRSINCVSGQGYFYSRPIPVADFYAMYTAQKAELGTAPSIQ